MSAQQPFRLFIATDDAKMVVTTRRPAVNGQSRDNTAGNITSITAVEYSKRGVAGVAPDPVAVAGPRHDPPGHRRHQHDHHGMAEAGRGHPGTHTPLHAVPGGSQMALSKNVLPQRYGGAQSSIDCGRYRRGQGWQTATA